MKIRNYSQEDAAKIVSWIRDERTFHMWSADRYPSYPIKAEDINRNYRMTAEREPIFPMTVTDGDEVIGHFVIRYLDKERRTLRFGFIIVDGSKRGRGYGRRMLTEGVEYAFREFDVDRITLGVYECNIAARRCYEAVGFRECSDGEDKYFFLEGKRVRCIEMEYLREEK